MFESISVFDFTNEIDKKNRKTVSEKHNRLGY